MEKAKVRSTSSLINEGVVLDIIKNIRYKFKNLDVVESIRELIKNGYSEIDSIRFSFMIKWNNKRNKRLATLPLYLHYVYYVVESGEYFNKIGLAKFVSTKKDIGYMSKYVYVNIDNLKINGLLSSRDIYNIENNVEDCEILNIYNYKIGDIIKSDSVQIL
jgi:hypothetical protein